MPDAALRRARGATIGRLVDAGFVTVAPDGRRRAFRLARPEVALALEALALVSPPRAERTLRRATRAEAERAARTCYDRLAGALGVAMADALLARQWVTRLKGGRALLVTAEGRAGLRSALGLEA